MFFNLNYEWHGFQAHYEAHLKSGVTCILGPSGGGKSTLLSLIGGYIKGAGTLQFNGKDLIPLPPYERPISTLFQSDNLFPQLSVWDNVAIGLSPSRKLSSEQKARVNLALEQTQMSSFVQKFPDQLSGGQAQRVAIARVLVRQKPILLLDEPFSALDPKLRDEMLVLVKTLTEEHSWTTIMVTHSPKDALLLDGDVMLIEAGRVQALSNAKILRDDPKKSPFSDYLGVS